MWHEPLIAERIWVQYKSISYGMFVHFINNAFEHPWIEKKTNLYYLQKLY